MTFLEKLKHLLQRFLGWMRATQDVGPFSIVVLCVAAIVKMAHGYHDKFEKWEAAWELPMKPEWLAWYETVHPYLLLFGQLAIIGLVIHAIRVYPDVKKLVWPIFMVGALFFCAGLMKELRDEWWVQSYGMFGEPRSLFFLGLKQVMLAIILLSPAWIVSWYAGQPMLQRYTLKAFIQPLMFCYTAFASLWILMDLMDKMKDFQEAKIDKDIIIALYVDLIPAVYVMVTPAAVLLAALYSLTKLSRSNEIVSMLTSGLSLKDILKPILIVTAYLSLLGMALNYHWAPRADGERESMMRDLQDNGRVANAATAIMHRNEKTGRTWSIGSVPFDLLNNKMKMVSVYQTDGKGRLKVAWRAKTAKWWAPRSNPQFPLGVWAFYNGTERTYKGGVAAEEKFFDGTVDGITRIDQNDWPETPWSIISASLSPDTLGVNDLVAYEEGNKSLPSEKLAPFRTHFFHRFAYPWQAFVIVLMAAPLGVAFSRRGALGGIAAAVIIFFIMMFVNEFFLNMGKGHHMAPWLAAFMPNVIFGVVGIIVFVQKAQNKDLPKFAPQAWLRALKTWWSQRQLTRAAAGA